ncbi:MAG: hypothetical protein QOD39_5164, partial [Mycobacterium sp.]|nr:hypothetical protein [Mycobacterium sp.]
RRAGPAGYRDTFPFAYGMSTPSPSREPLTGKGRYRRHPPEGRWVVRSGGSGDSGPWRALLLLAQSDSRVSRERTLAHPSVTLCSRNADRRDIHPHLV